MRLIVLVSLLGLLLASCATPYETTSSVPLGPGGRVQGVLRIPAGTEATLRLANRGPGRADFVVREDGGDVLQQGPLHEAQATVGSTEPVELVVVLEAYEDSGTSVSWQVVAPSGAAFEWDLSGQYRGGQ